MASKRKGWVARAIAKASATPEAERAAEALVSLALAPVKPAPYYPPLDLDDAPVIEVHWLPVPVQAPTRDNGSMVTPCYGDPDEWTDAMRAYLTAAQPWGREKMRVAALLPDGRRVLLEGRESDVRQVLPDQSTLESWGAAGAFAVEVHTGPDSVAWTSLEDAPRALQLEHLSRAIAR